MRISQLTFEPKTKYFKVHSGARHTPLLAGTAYAELGSDQNTALPV